MVVLWGDYLRYNDLPIKGLYWGFPPANMRPQMSNPYYLDGGYHLHCFLDLLPLFNGLPMPPDILLLEAISCTGRCVRSLCFINCYCKLNLYPWGIKRNRRLDFGHDTYFHCVELANEYSNQSIGGFNPSAWCYVMSPTTFYLNTSY